MSNTIKPKRSNTSGKVPTTSDLSSGEFGVNMADQKSYINNGTSVVQVGSGKLTGLSDVSVTSPTVNQALVWNGTSWVNGSGGGSGNVTSVALSMPSGFSVSGSPVTTSGTLGVTTTLNGAIQGNGSGLTAISNTGTGNNVLASAPTISGEWGNFDGIKFNTSPSITPTVGEIFWNSTQQAPEVQLDASVQGTVTQDNFFYVKASSAITKGQVCMFTGSVGASGVLTAAPASGTIDGLIIMGVAAESIALNGFGYIQSTGTLKGINTSGFTAGAILYYDPTVTGGLTATTPAKSSTQVIVAAVINSNNNGSIFVRLTYFPEFGDLPNISLTTPATNNLLQYNGTNWVNVAPSSVTGVGSVANSITPGTGISGSAYNGSAAQTWNLANTAVTAGSYTNASITVDAQGRLTSASSGTAPVTSVGATAPIASSGGATPTISISQATTSTNGYLSSTDWNTFNNKQPAGSYLTTVTADSPLTGSGTSASHLSMPAATGSVNGYLTSTDWTTFNNKQPAGAYLTTVTADSPLTGSGTSASHLSIPAATTSVSGYLTSTDWNTFNNKGFTWQSVKTTSFTATAGNYYPVSTAGGTVTATLPASPTAGQYVSFTDYSGTFATYNLTINNNGNKIDGLAISQICSTNRSTISLVYVDTTQGWITFSNIVPSYNGYAIDYLIVAGGGGGGYDAGGGAGAGGYQTGSTAVATGSSNAIVVGAGGAGGSSGSMDGTSGANSSIVNFTATASVGGGGGGSNSTSGAGKSGGSGGGPGIDKGSTFGSGTTGQGNNGGSSNGSIAGPGGGKNAAGNTGGNGGDGLAWLNGTVYAGGGGGGCNSGFTSLGGAGGGGKGGTYAGSQPGPAGTAGTANTGGGGGGGSGWYGPGGNGGSGIVIIRYAGTQRGTGGTVTSAGGYTYHTFTTSGTYTG